MEYQYVANMYGGQVPGQDGVGTGIGILGQQRQGNGQMPFNYGMNQPAYMMNGSVSGSSNIGGANQGGSQGPVQGPAGANPYFPMYYGAHGQAQNMTQQAYGFQGPNNLTGSAAQSPYGNSIPPVPGPYSQLYFGSQQGVPGPSNTPGGNSTSRTSNGNIMAASQHMQLQQQQQRQQSQPLPQQQPLPQPQPQLQPQNQPHMQLQPPPQAQRQKGRQRQKQQQNPPAQHQPPPSLQSVPPNMPSPSATGQKQGQSPNPAMSGPRSAVSLQGSAPYPYPLRKYLSNLAILRAHEIINLLNVSNNKLNDMKYWVRIMSELFTPYGLFRYSRKHQEDIRQFEFTAVVIPSVMRSFGSSGVARLEIVPHQLRAQVLSNGTIFFECPRCLLTYFFPDGSYMTNFTHFKGVFDTSLKIEWLDMFTYSFVPGVEWGSLETKLSDLSVSAEIFAKLSSAGDKRNTSSNDGNRNKNNSNIKTESSPSELDSSRFQAMTQLRSQFKVFQNVSS